MATAFTAQDTLEQVSRKKCQKLLSVALIAFAHRHLACEVESARPILEDVKSGCCVDLTSIKSSSSPRACPCPRALAQKSSDEFQVSVSRHFVCELQPSHADSSTVPLQADFSPRRFRSHMSWVVFLIKFRRTNEGRNLTFLPRAFGPWYKYCTWYSILSHFQFQCIVLKGFDIIVFTTQLHFQGPKALGL